MVRLGMPIARRAWGVKPSVESDPAAFDLYDIIPEKKAPSAVAAPERAAPLETGVSDKAEGSTIAIREMLSGVKDVNGAPYFQTEGPAASASPPAPPSIGNM